MGKTLFSQYRQQNLKELVDHLKNDYYKIISGNCEHIHNIAGDISDKLQSADDSSYIATCAALAKDLRDDIHLSEVIIPPYAYELHEKLSNRHDCTNCTGTCHVNHNFQLRGVKAAHEKVKEQLRRLEDMMDQEYATNATGPVKLMRNEIACLDTILTELLFLEEAILIPKILEAQTAINANR